MSTAPAVRRPILYDDERNPECRRVRLCAMQLDLDLEIRPCPPRGRRFLEEAKRLGGVDTPPLLVDEAHGVVLSDPSEIVAHLRKTYPPGETRTFDEPASELELYAYETCPFCAYVRDTLNSLELAYTMWSMGPGSEKRGAFRARYGKTQFPFLRDARAGIELFESGDIVHHLRATYGAG